MPITTTTEENVGTPGHSITPERKPPVAGAAPCSAVPLPWHYAYSHETPSQKLWNEEDMRDYAKNVLNATLARFQSELEKQRMHFFKLEDSRAEPIYNVLVVVDEALKAAIRPPNAELCRAEGRGDVK